MMDMISAELNKGAAPAELLDFLSSVCRTESKGHETMQSRTTQLLCGLVAEGADPHLSSLIYHIRTVAAYDSSHGSRRLHAVEVQISACSPPCPGPSSSPSTVAPGRVRLDGPAYLIWILPFGH